MESTKLFKIALLTIWSLAWSVLSQSCFGPKYSWADVGIGPKYYWGQSIPQAKMCLGPKYAWGQSECGAKWSSGPNWLWACQGTAQSYNIILVLNSSTINNLIKSKQTKPNQTKPNQTKPNYWCFHLIFHFRVILNRLARFTWKLSCNGQLKRSRPRPFGSSKKKMGVSPSNSVVVRWSDASTKSTLTNSWPLFSVSPPSVHIAVTLFGAWANRAISAKFAYVWSTSAVTSSSRQSVLESKNWQSLTM